jgi:hypothetical protein
LKLVEEGIAIGSLECLDVNHRNGRRSLVECQLQPGKGIQGDGFLAQTKFLCTDGYSIDFVEA